MNNDIYASDASKAAEVVFGCNSKQAYTPPRPWTPREWNLNMFFNIMCWCGSFFGTTKLSKSNVARKKMKNAMPQREMCKWQLAWLDTQQSSITGVRSRGLRDQNSVQKVSKQNTRKISRKQQNNNNPTFLYHYLDGDVPAKKRWGWCFLFCVFLFFS